jgi:hypothetical protein
VPKPKDQLLGGGIPLSSEGARQGISVEDLCEFLPAEADSDLGSSLMR